jgi:hypothetical protein
MKFWHVVYQRDRYDWKQPSQGSAIIKIHPFKWVHNKNVEANRHSLEPDYKLLNWRLLTDEEVQILEKTEEAGENRKVR